MRLHKIPYDDAVHFSQVRDFLVDSYRATGIAQNWMIDRWEFCRAFAHTMMGTQALWPSTVGLWRDAGGILTVATSEGEGRGEAHFLVRPRETLSTELIGALFDHAESALSVGASPRLRLRLWEGRPELEAEARRRGYRRSWTEVMSHRPVVAEEPGDLPEGYRLAWGTQVEDTAKGRGHIRAFGYENDPRSQTTASCWTALRTMPDWRSELELFALAPDGSVAAFVNLWLDRVNHVAICEPVGTDPDHRRRGLARALILEGARRVRALGATELLVGSDQAFYQSCGFVPRERHGVWEL